MSDWVKDKHWFGDSILPNERETKTFITINTDASYNFLTQLGAYAFWIFGDGINKRAAGVYKEKLDASNASTNCEILAIGNAIAAVKNLGFEARFDICVINTDCKDAIRFFLGKYDTGNQQTNTAKLMYKRLMKKNKARCQFRYVPAHAGNMEGRSYVNEWCDLACRNARRVAEGKTLLTMANKDNYDYKKTKK